MLANQATFPVSVMSEVFHVSSSGFYAWKARPPSLRALGNAVMSERIRRIYADSDATYGMPRVRAELIEQGERISAKRVAHLMRAAHLRGVSRRRGYVVTTQRDQRQRPAPDLVNRHFVADAPNVLWLADITYIPTWAGFIFLAVVLDVWSRRVVGWSIGETLETSLILAALNMAVQQRKPVSVIHHSDQGSQYTSVAFGQRCKAMGVRASMGSVGDAYDNAMAESFFASLECELLDRRCFKTKTDARLAVFTWIEGWYNPRRRHSALGYQSPLNFERRNTNVTPPLRIEHGFPTVGSGVGCATPPVDNPAPLTPRSSRESRPKLST